MGPLLAASLLASAALVQGPHHGHEPQLGSVHFETSCNEEAQTRFHRALGWLHSFEYEQAGRTFAEAAEADPRCAIAHWGVAMSLYHPLWAPPSAAELATGRQALATARQTASGSERERAYIEALETFYAQSDSLDHRTRMLAYSDAMERLHRLYPQDHEAAVFYALSLIAAGTTDDDPAFERENRAGAILNAVLAEAPGHPGVAHYLIHSFDYPPLAELALQAARSYANLAPASPHAQHMPSHIFVRLGLWDEAIRSNLASHAAAIDLARAQGLPDSSSERLHAMDYLAYGYLQTGQDGEAARVLADLNGIRRADPPSFAVAYAATAIPARLTLERRQWEEAASLTLADNVLRLAPLDTFGWAEAQIHFARAIGSARLGRIGAAQTEIARLGQIEQSLVIPAGAYDWRTQVAIERQIAEAWLAQAEGRSDEAVRILGAAAELDERTEKHPVTPGAILPAREQLGELLLLLERPAEALTEFEASLRRAPRRLAGLHGAARSARLAGDLGKARLYHEQVVALTSAGDPARVEIREARAFLAQASRE